MLSLPVSHALADGIYRNGVGARAMALGGADVAYAADPLGAMAANPAGLGFLIAPELDLSFNTASAYGSFSKPGISGSLDQTPGVYPDAAFAMPLGQSRVTAGISFVTDSAISADWHYQDPASSSGVSYGYQRDKSEIVVFRSALGAGIEISPQWSIGASVGLDYNDNTLQAPYIFQTAPGLAGAKVLLDLRTSGLGWNGQGGILFHPREDLQFGLSYKSPTTIYSHGNASGDAGPQLIALGAPLPTYDYHYDAQVRNLLPQMVALGASWKFSDQWRLALQVDWINWGDSFTQLPVSLTHGHAVGQPAGATFVLPANINDFTPLDWSDQFIYRGGVEYFATTNFVLRGGYSYGKSPVPDQTLTPLTATITEHTLTAGAGYRWKRYTFDFAYQWDIPATRDIGSSGLQAGEYSNSSTRIGIQTISLTTGIRF